MPGSKTTTTDCKNPSSKSPCTATSMCQTNDFATSRTQSFVQEPPHNGNTLAILPYQTTNVDARRREKKVKMMDYIAGFDHEFRG
ncbi:hypothetical protein Daus18300_000406 [Diaporthe australafricana]|uniref:Uncharacterized protein n=1 Tax=Diaporthe australafricana TaxID=127596 RepID=A0ABR3Y694_9PEZI